MKDLIELEKILPARGIELMTGKLLGDANIAIQNNRRPRFRFSHCANDHNWCIHCFEELHSYLPINQPIYRKTSDSRVKEGYTDQYYVQSKVAKAADLLKEIWYPNNKKFFL